LAGAVIDDAGAVLTGVEAGVVAGADVALEGIAAGAE
jgi:hypothetical protein